MNRLTSLYLALLGVVAYGAEPSPVVAMQWSPDQIALSLRTTKPPMPAADCAALGVFACKLSYPEASPDVSIRWVQLDDDPELEAVIVANMKAEWDYFAFVFDRKQTWNLVGKMRCERHCYTEGNGFVQVYKLTENAPIFLVVRRDLGGSGSSLDTRTFFHLSGGALQKAFEVTDQSVFLFQGYIEKIKFRQAKNWLIQHTTREEPPESTPKHSCKVLTWSPRQLTYIDAPEQQPNYCNPKTGRPFADKTWGIPAY